jgi:outer membrane protein assembly factor BamB
MMRPTIALVLLVFGLANANSLWSRSSWNGWGGGISNTRWAQDGKVNPANAKSITLHCQLKYTDGESAAPTISGDMAYYPTWSGLLVALNYKTCQTVWEANITQIVYDFAPVSAHQTLLAQAVSRTSLYLADGYLYAGTHIHALLLAVDASNGAVVGRKQLSNHPLAVITQSPTVYDGRIFVGVSSVEETASAEIPGYQCCSFAGSMVALTFDCVGGTFHTAWEVSMLPTPQRDWSGVAVWGSQPSIDQTRSQVFIATGNVYKAPAKYEACAKRVQSGKSSASCLPRRVLQESVVALDIRTGHINWVRHLAALDAWTVACLPGAIPGNKKKNCPAAPGPDADFGMAPSFVSGSANTPGGRDTLVVGQKNGNLYAVSPEDGSVQWATHTSPDGVDGGISWGVAVDESRVYYTAMNWDIVPWKLRPSGRTIRNSAWGAANLTDGAILWNTQVQPNTSLSQVPPSVAKGVVITGRTSLNEIGPESSIGGELVMLDAASGDMLGSMPLDAPFHGGIAIHNEYLFFGSGYSNGFYNTTGSFYTVKVALSS